MTTQLPYIASRCKNYPATKVGRSRRDRRDRRVRGSHGVRALPVQGPIDMPKSRPRGFTLIEVLIVMGLLVVIFSAIWSIVEMFTKSFVRGESRAERSQLVRSLSLLVTDDLGCAIQDPLHPARESNTNAVRRFGLSGTNTSIRIDVLQINPFRTGDMAVQDGVQAPELKTVYYDFSLFSPNGGGLTRRELDFETPTGMPGQQNAGSAGMSLTDGDSGDADQLSAIGSDAPSFADYGTASLTDSVSAANEAYSQQRQTSMISPDAMAANATARYVANEKLQLEMSAPEVVGCWFRYFDGAQWCDEWNSLNQKGLPVAIEITLKMMPLADSQTLRNSPLAFQVVNQPGMSSIAAANEAAYAKQYATNTGTMQQNASGMSALGSGSPTMADYSAGAASFADRGEASSLTDTVTRQNMMMRSGPVGLSVEQLAAQLDLLPPTEQRIVVRVPTTPLTSQKELQREQPKVAATSASTNPRMQAPRTVEQPRRAATTNAQRQQRSSNRQQSPAWIRQ